MASGRGVPVASPASRRRGRSSSRRCCGDDSAGGRRLPKENSSWSRSLRRGGGSTAARGATGGCGRLGGGVAGGSLADSSPSEDATLPQSDWAAAGLLSRGFCGGRAGVAGVAAAGRGAGSSPGLAADFAPRDSARLAQGSFFCSCSDIDEFQSGIVVRGLCRATEQNPAKCRTGMLLTTGRPAEYYKSRQRGSRRRLVSGNQRPAGAGGQHYGVGSRERARIMLPLSATSKSGR